MGLLPICDFISLYIGDMENIDSLNYAGIPNGHNSECNMKGKKIILFINITPFTRKAFLIFIFVYWLIFERERGSKWDRGKEKERENPRRGRETDREREREAGLTWSGSSCSPKAGLELTNHEIMT